MNTCHLGCGKPALYFHAKTGVGRCSKHNASCPVIIERKAVKRKTIVKPELIPEICECGKPGIAYSKRSKRWRCDVNQGNCSALAAKRDDTLMKKYGTTKIAHINGVQERRSETLTKNHALRSPEEKEKITDKRLSTMVDRYGVENIGQHTGTRQKIMENNLEKYGVEHTLQVSEFREAGKKTMIERYGAVHPSHVPSIIEQKKQTMMDRYGVEYPYQSEVIREKFKETMLEHWGAETPMHVPELLDRQFKSSHSHKNFELPSGRITFVQGFEPNALKYLLSNGYLEEDFVFETKNKPIIDYVDYDNSKRKYFPDLFLIKTKHIIEVKCYYTLYNNEMTNYARNKRKQQASLDAGYKFTFMIFTDNGVFDKFEGDELFNLTQSFSLVTVSKI